MAGISSLIFATRNLDKATHGDYGRFTVAAAQTANVTSEAAKSSIGFVSKGAQNILSKVDTFGEKAFHVADASGKIARVASKAVNPLLVCAAGIRVMKDNDKKSRAIEEGAALGSMFLGEKVYKLARNTISQQLGNTLKEGQKVIKNEAILGKLSKVAEKINNITKGSTGKQKLLFILAEIGFVATSIIGFNIGKKIGKKITGRTDDQNLKTNQNQIQDKSVNGQRLQVSA